MAITCEWCDTPCRCTETRTLEHYVRRAYVCGVCGRHVTTKEYVTKVKDSQGNTIKDFKDKGFYAAGSE